MAGVRLNNNDVAALREAFVLFDYHKSGRIEASNVGTVVRSIGLMPSDEEIRAIVDDCNRNGNGEIDLQTLVSVISSKTTNPGNLPPNDMNELFRMYDKDNSGRITVAEMRHLLTTVGEKLSEEEADTLFKMTGCLEQGRVNYQKLLQHVMGQRR